MMSNLGCMLAREEELRVLVVHNQYQQRGGEDSVVEAEIALLHSMGADVHTMIYDSRDEQRLQQVKRRPDLLAFNGETYRHARRLIVEYDIQVVHCHNLFPLLTTSIYAAAHAENTPIIQTVHNYRMGCLNGLHLRRGEVCERCRPGYHLPGMAFGCYRSSHVQSMAFGAVQTINYLRRAWDEPTLYVAPGQFLADKLIAWGVPRDKVVVKPHFVPYTDTPSADLGDYALFVGRLSAEKGLDLLLDAWSPHRLPLIIVGDGPLREHLAERIHREGLSNVSLVGYQEKPALNNLLHNARFLVMPSVCFETFGLVLIEAYAHGVPVIATRLGAMGDVVRDGVTGHLFTLNDRDDLATKVSWLEKDTEELRRMRQAARREYETSFSPDANRNHMRAMYTYALQQRASDPRVPTGLAPEAAAADRLTRQST